MKSPHRTDNVRDLEVAAFGPNESKCAYRRILDMPARRVSSIDIKPGEKKDLHAHGGPHLAWTHSGAARIETANCEFLLAPTQAIWISARSKYRGSVLRPLEQVELRTLMLPSTPTTTERPSTLLCVSPLLRVLIDSLDQESRSMPVTISPEREQWITSLIADEAACASPSRWRIQLPVDARLAALCETVRNEPANLRKIDSSAPLCAGLSRRNRSRIFAQDLGVTWKDWSQTVVMSHARALLLAGLPVGRVATLCGYGVSAFSSMFSAAEGVAPFAFSRMTKYRQDSISRAR